MRLVGDSEQQVVAARLHQIFRQKVSPRQTRVQVPLIRHCNLVRKHADGLILQGGRHEPGGQRHHGMSLQRVQKHARGLIRELGRHLTRTAMDQL